MPCKVEDLYLLVCFGGPEVSIPVDCRGPAKVEDLDS